MQKQISLKLLPAEAADELVIKNLIAKHLGFSLKDITGFYIKKKSIDARSKQPWVNLTLQAFVQEPFLERVLEQYQLQELKNQNKKIIIIGAGPAGLFAALTCLEMGIKPIVIERGKDIRARRRDLAQLNKLGIVNPESNYCFGEGGAGTYSDGKLYTRSNKRGSIDKVLNWLVQFGADEKIVYESHPHIGTNKLPKIIENIREAILSAGGEIYFEHKVIDFKIQSHLVKEVITNQGLAIQADAVILATGHSARDIFELLYQKNIQIEAKPFALGVRIEHPQELINQIQYHCIQKDPHLPPAAYSLVEQVKNKGVFSFCMCPGGIIAPAATSEQELVVNGWSPSKRDNPYANSGMVVEINDADLAFIKKDFTAVTQLPVEALSTPLRLMYYQQYVERKSYTVGGGNFKAPAQRMVDFSKNKISATLPTCSYVPGLTSADLQLALPQNIHYTLQEGFKQFGKKMKGYYTNDAVVVATESRTSSPVRIPRDSSAFNHPQIHNLFPCGEGAGYAGGIVSAAMDGMKIAAHLAEKFI